MRNEWQRAMFAAFGVVWIATAAACGVGNPLSERAFPLRFDSIGRLNGARSAWDLDSDGWNELLQISRREVGLQSMVFTTITGRVLAERVYEADRAFMPRRLRVLGGPGLETLVPLVRNDSLLLIISDENDRHRLTLLLAERTARTGPAGAIPWDPSVRSVRLVDVTGDGVAELVTVIATAYAGLPRGIVVHSLPDGRPLDRLIVGADLIWTVISDFDGDGNPEMIAASSAVNNGAVAGGLDDSVAYLLRFEFRPTIRLVRKEVIGGAWHHTQLHVVDWHGGTQPALFIATMALGTGPSVLELRDAKTWTTIRRRTLPASLQGPKFFDLDGDAKPELLFLTPSSEIWVLDREFRTIRTASLPMPAHTLSHANDLDGDGKPELIASGDQMGIQVLGEDLRVKALRRGGHFLFDMPLPDAPPVLLAADAGGAVVLGVQANPWSFAYRLGPGVAAGVSLSALLWALLAAFARRRRTLVMAAVRDAITKASAERILLLDRRGTVAWMNAEAQRAFGSVRTAGALADRHPTLAAFCVDQLATHPSQKAELAQHGRASDPDVGHASLEPLTTGVHGDPHWLLRVRDTKDDESSRAEMAAWRMMAQRVAHGLKNPLTSMLLTLHHLRREYREHAPGAAERLDGLTTRIHDRVDALRTMTTNFLKFVNAEKPAFRNVSLADEIRRFADAVTATLPPDIRLNVEAKGALPAVALDSDQFESVLDNLVANAVNAMPTGGVITVKARLVRGVKPAELASGDYVIVEVLDTGSGIPADIRLRIFDAGFSTDETGTGLGLAIVRKIVVDHGGTVTVESEAGSGSVFAVYLPVPPR